MAQLTIDYLDRIHKKMSVASEILSIGISLENKIALLMQSNEFLICIIMQLSIYS